MLFQLFPVKTHRGSWAWGSMEKGNPDSLKFTCYDRSFAKDPGYTGSILISILTKKIANNTKINHIMVSFIDHYNAISIDRLSSKTKIGKYSWYFNNSLLCKPEVSSATKTFLFLLRNTHKKTSTAAVDPQHLKVEVAD